MEIRSAASLPKRVRIECGGGRAKQSFKEECDINTIMGRYIATGALPPMMQGGDYGVASAVTYHEALNTVREAEEMFNNLPSKLRNRFEGDPARFLDYVQDEDNEPEMLELGLLSDDASERVLNKMAEKKAADLAAAPKKDSSAVTEDGEED